MKSTPRWKVAATKPQRSPTTPPPKAIKQVVRLWRFQQERCDRLEAGKVFIGLAILQLIDIYLPLTKSAKHLIQIQRRNSFVRNDCDLLAGDQDSTIPRILRVADAQVANMYGITSFAKINLQCLSV